MNPELRRIVDSLMKQGRVREAQAVKAVTAAYDGMNLRDLLALILYALEDENARSRVRNADRLMDAFREASSSLSAPPVALVDELQVAVSAGVAGGNAMLAVLATTPDLIEAFRMRPDEEIDYVRHSMSRLTRYWGIEQQRFSQEVQTTIIEALERGQGRRDIEDALKRRLEISRNRAHVIARNELGNAASHAMQATQTSRGITHYEWFTARDDRVRGKPGGRYAKASPSHYARHGRIFAWDSPPSDGHPGQPIMCRCVAIAVLPGRVPSQ